MTSPTNSPDAAQPDPVAADRVERITDDQGVDLTVIRATLALTPTERLKSLENALNVLATVRPRPTRP